MKILFPQGTSIFTKKAISTSITPNLVILGLVDEEAFTGVKNKNPFNFTTAKLQKIELSINGSILKIEPDYSSFCGYYCILFSLFKARCFNLKKFLSYFKDSNSNDLLLKNLIKKFE